MKSPEMGGYTPEEEKKLSPRDMLVQSGIAERMIKSIKKFKGILDPKITFGVEDCDFRVQQTVISAEKSGTGQKEMHAQVIIEMPNLHPENRKKQPRVTQAFGVKEGGSFGDAGEPPLTQEQWNTILNILKEQKTSK
jgi:hypothetical protein